MASLGQKLADARKRKGISIPDAHEGTKIRGDYLEKFENDDFTVKLPRVYLRGFLKNYAAYLDLDPEGIAADFDAIQPDDPKGPRKTFGTISVDSPTEATPLQDLSQPVPEANFPWAKVSLILGGLLASTVILVLLVKALSSDGDEPKKPIEKQPVAEQSQSHVLKLIATGPIKLLVVKPDSKDQASQTFRNLKEGDEKEITLTGGPSFTAGASSIENLTFEIDGKQFGFQGTGARLIRWPPKEQ
ncbi:MAG: helix-turn-helix domain-containing protein [Opitutales bacterium]